MLLFFLSLFHKFNAGLEVYMYCYPVWNQFLPDLSFNYDFPAIFNSGKPISVGLCGPVVKYPLLARAPNSIPR